MSRPLLFYSRKDTNSINLWKKLQSSNRLNEFVKICVDNNSKIPPMITSVPTIFVKGRPLILGPAINMYLQSVPQVSNMGQTPQSNNQRNNQSNNQSNTTNPKPTVKTSTNNLEGISDFNPVEMSGAYSDSYSFIQDKPSPMDFCYQFINDLEDDAITNGAKGINKNGPNKIPTNNVYNSRSRGLDSKLEQMQKDRANVYTQQRRY